MKCLLELSFCCHCWPQAPHIRNEDEKEKTNGCSNFRVFYSSCWGTWTNVFLWPLIKQHFVLLAHFCPRVIPKSRAESETAIRRLRRKHFKTFCGGCLRHGGAVARDDVIVVNAVYTWFMLFHVLKLQFPDDCLPLWCFFDNCGFKINGIASPPSSILT